MAAACGLVAAGGLVYVGKRIARRWQRRVVVDPLATAPEGIVEGSRLMSGGRPPSCQVAVAFEDPARSGELVVVGAGLRMEDYLVTPSHCCRYGFAVWLIGQNGKHVKVDSEELVLCPDVSAFYVPAAQWSQLGVAMAKLGPVALGSTVSVVSSADRQHTVGSLQLGQSLGRVFYTGSTLPGFSGAAYMNGNVAVGIHCHGGASAGGYECLYVWCRLKHALVQSPESSEYFVKNLRGKRSKVRFEELGEGVVVLREPTGHYHLTNAEVLAMIAEDEPEPPLDDWAQYMDWAWPREEMRRRKEAGQWEPESRILDFQRRSLQPPAREQLPQLQGPPSQDSSGKVQSRRQPLTEREQLMRLVGSVSSARLKEFLASQCPPGNMLPRILRQKQSSAPSGSRLGGPQNSGPPTESR